MAGDDDGAGYRKPPKATRFRKGRSGNPKGRPKGTRNFATDLNSELRRSVRIREGDNNRKVSRQRAAITAMVAKAAGGDMRAMNMLVRAMERLDGGEPPAREPSAEDEEVLAAFEKELREQFREEQARQSKSCSHTPVPEEKDDE